MSLDWARGHQVFFQTPITKKDNDRHLWAPKSISGCFFTYHSWLDIGFCKLTALDAHRQRAAPSGQCACVDSSALRRLQPSAPPQTTGLCPSGTACTPETAGSRVSDRCVSGNASSLIKFSAVGVLLSSPTSLDCMMPNKGNRRAGRRAVTARGRTSVHQYTAIKMITKPHSASCITKQQHVQIYWNMHTHVHTSKDPLWKVSYKDLRPVLHHFRWDLVMVQRVKISVLLCSIVFGQRFSANTFRPYYELYNHPLQSLFWFYDTCIRLIDSPDKIHCLQFSEGKMNLV